MSFAEAADYGWGDNYLCYSRAAQDPIGLCLDRPFDPAQAPPLGPNYGPITLAEDGEPIATVQQVLAASRERMWEPGHVLSVKFVCADTDAGQVCPSESIQDRVRRLSATWSDYANFRFEYVDASVPADVVIAFDPRDGNWSWLGRQNDAFYNAAQKHTMNLGELLNPKITDQRFQRVVLHEFGHSMGLIHEHQSPASPLIWNEDRVYDWCQSMGWSRQKCLDQVLTPAAADSTNYSQYDPLSIMHYEISAGLLQYQSGTPFNYELSPIDRAQIRRFYPFAPNSSGTLRRGNGCDEIAFQLEHGAGSDPLSVTFELEAAPGLAPWRQIYIPLDTGLYRTLETSTGSRVRMNVPMARLGVRSSLLFAKPGIFGSHRQLDYSWYPLQAVTSGSRLRLTWTRDCG